MCEMPDKTTKQSTCQLNPCIATRYTNLIRYQNVKSRMKDATFYLMVNILTDSTQT